MAAGSARGGSRADLNPFLRRAAELGAARARVIRVTSVVVAEWVRWKCRYGCGGWGRRLTCPPNSPEPESTRRLLAGYRRAILLEAGHGEVRKIIPSLEREVFLYGFHKAFGLGSGPCSLCPSCPATGSCRHPDRARPAMEACGIDVFSTVRAAGWRIQVVRSRAETPRFFGLLLVD